MRSTLSMNIRILFLSALCIALAGCGHRYQIKPLKHIKKTEADFREKKDNIELRVKQLNRSKIEQLFNNQYIENRHITPLLLTIKNDSPETVTLENSFVNLTLLSSEEIQSYLSKNTPLKVVLGITAIPVVVVASVFGGAVLATLLGIHGCCAMGYVVFPFLASVFIGIPVIVGTTGYHAHDSAKFNTTLASDLHRKVLSTQTIAPGTKESALLFTKDLPETFTITLLKEQQPVLFAVTLKNQITK